MDKKYLGDSIYAKKESNGGVILTTENGLPDDPSNIIFMGREEFESLKQFMETGE